MSSSKLVSNIEKSYQIFNFSLCKNPLKNCIDFALSDTSLLKGTILATCSWFGVLIKIHIRRLLTDIELKSCQKFTYQHFQLLPLQVEWLSFLDSNDNFWSENRNYRLALIDEGQTFQQNPERTILIRNIYPYILATSKMFRQIQRLNKCQFGSMRVKSGKIWINSKNPITSTDMLRRIDTLVKYLLLLKNP